jgi:hypothetical protein
MACISFGPSRFEYVAKASWGCCRRMTARALGSGVRRWQLTLDLALTRYLPVGMVVCRISLGVIVLSGT